MPSTIQPSHSFFAIQSKHSDVTKVIINAGFEVLNALKPGLDEKLYENALVVELNLRSIVLSQQTSFSVNYKRVHIGKFIPDLIVSNKILRSLCINFGVLEILNLFSQFNHFNLGWTI